MPVLIYNNWLFISVEIFVLFHMTSDFQLNSFMCLYQCFQHPSRREGSWILAAYFQIVMEVQVSLLVSINFCGWGEGSSWLLTRVEFLAASMPLGHQVSSEGQEHLVTSSCDLHCPCWKREGIWMGVMMKDLSFHMASSATTPERRDGPFLPHEGGLHSFVLVSIHT